MKAKLDKEYLGTVVDSAKKHLDALSTHLAAAPKSEDVDTNKASLHLADADAAIKTATNHVQTATKPAEASVASKPAAAQPQSSNTLKLIAIGVIAVVAVVLAFYGHKVGLF